VIGCEDCLQNDLYCVGWGVKLCSTNSTNDDDEEEEDDDDDDDTVVVFFAFR